MKLISTVILALVLMVNTAFALSSATQTQIVYATTNVTSSAWTQVLAGASVTKAVKGIYVYNSGSNDVWLATGGSGSETAQLAIPGGMTAGAGVYIPFVASQNTRLAIECTSVGATNSSGEFAISVLYN